MDQSYHRFQTCLIAQRRIRGWKPLPGEAWEDAKGGEMCQRGRSPMLGSLGKGVHDGIRDHARVSAWVCLVTIVLGRCLRSRRVPY